MRVLRTLIVMFAIILCGCATFSAPSSEKELKPNQSYWMSYDATRRGSVIVAGDSTVKTCSEPAPDVAMSFANALKGDFKVTDKASATGVDAALNATAMALAGRDDVVLLAREALFRICEASINGTINESDVKTLFEDVFKQVEAIAVAQASKARSDAAAEQSKTEQLKEQLKLKQLLQ